MKVSFIIVSYNEKEYLSQTINSCLKQFRGDDFEIIIGDDGSNDGSIELIQQFVSEYPNIIKYFVMDRSDAINIIPSLRVSNVLKRAFEMAEGKYLSIISGDDIYLDENKTVQQVEFLDKNQDYMSCFTNYVKFWSDGQKEKTGLHKYINESVMWAGQYEHISCFLFRRECLAFILERLCDDTGLMFSILKAGKSKYMDTYSFGYRQRDKSIMHEADKMELMVLELMLFQDCLNQGGLPKSTWARFSKILEYVFEHREELKNKKYEKYVRNCKDYDNDYLGMLLDYDNLDIREQRMIKRNMKLSVIYKNVFKMILRF